MITVVTICLNAENFIKETMYTVINQKGTEIEYIIKDGDSTDRTNDMIDRVISENRNPLIHFRHIVLKDSGIYDAMNQAIDQSNGEWIIFMNAGDRFYDPFVLRNAALYMDNKIDVLYGDTLFSMKGGYYFPQIHDVSIINRHFNLGHQSCIVRAEIIKKYKFDTCYKIAGDYEQLNRLYCDHRKFVHMNMIVSTCNREGISCQKTNLQFDEVYRIQHEGKLIKDVQYRRKLWLWKIKGRIALTFPEWESYRYCKNNMKRINADYDKV